MHNSGKQNYNMKYFTVCSFVGSSVFFHQSILRFLLQDLSIEFQNKLFIHQSQGDEFLPFP